MKLAYYPGCSAEGSGIELGLSTERVAKIFDIELVEIDDWNCCGATSGHSTNKLLSLALPARNLAIAEEKGLDMLAPCAACYSRHRAAEIAIREDTKMRERISGIIDRDVNGSIRTLSILEVLAGLGTEKIASKVTNPLTTMKAACYYGCLLVRPVENTGFDDPEDPQIMDRIMRSLGADPVEWSHKTECCGASLVTSRPDIGKPMLSRIFADAVEAGAECIITACPLCMLNLDMRQAALEKDFGKKFNMPIYYLTEVIALACGDKPETVGTNRHFVEAQAYLALIKTRAEKLAQEEARAAAEAKARAEEKARRKDEIKPSSTDDKEALQKKVDGMIKALEKNPDKMAQRLIPDQEQAEILSGIIKGDEKKRTKLAELLVKDPDKASKAAEAYVNAELKNQKSS